MSKINILEQYNRAILVQIQSEVSYISDLIKHSGEKGRLNEHILIELLKKFLPKKYSIGSGFVIDKKGQQSKQFDIIIYDSLYNSTLLAQKIVGLFPIELVYLVIQVKTTLTQQEIKSAIININSLKKLEFISDTIPVPQVTTEYPLFTFSPTSYSVQATSKSSGPEVLVSGSGSSTILSDSYSEKQKGVIKLKKTTKPEGIIFAYTSTIKQNKIIKENFIKNISRKRIKLDDLSKNEELLSITYILSKSLFIGWEYDEKNKEYYLACHQPKNKISDSILTKGLVAFIIHVLNILNYKIITKEFDLDEYLPNNFYNFLEET